MRYVISKEEVCQAWVGKCQDHAHTPTRNLSFETFNRLYSYTTVIASRVTTPLDKEVIFVTTNNYSVTTNAQLRILNDILHSTSRRVIWVPYECPQSVRDMPSVWNDMVKDVQALWKKAQRARQRKDSLIAEGNHIMSMANKLVDIFGEGVTKGIAVESIEEMQEEMRVNEALIQLRA